MPLISTFYGILIRMNFKDTGKHNLPHFHAKYQGEEAVLDLDGNILAGNLPVKQLRLVLAWIELHRDELVALWDTMQEDGEYFKIEGLK